MKKRSSKKHLAAEGASDSRICKPNRGYYTGKATKKSRRNGNEVFNIESVVCGDGCINKNGLSLRNLVIYASDRIDGGIESYYEVDSDSLMFTTRGSKRGGNWHIRAISDRARKREPTAVPRVKIPSARRDDRLWVRRELREAALSWLFQNRGYALSVGGPGDRQSIVGIEEHLVYDKRTVFEKQNDGNCISAAITNAVELEVGERVREYFHEENPHFLKIREATLLLHELATDAEMRLPPKEDRENFNANRFAYLANRTHGVYIVNVFQLKVVSHTLVIDANRKLIIDSAEDFPMRLGKELLRKCGGDQAKDLRVGEVRIVCDQAQSRKNR